MSNSQPDVARPSKPMDHVEELRYVAAMDQCAWDYARALMRSSADRIEALLKDCSDETTAGRALHDEECANCGEGWSKHLTNKLICPDAAISDAYRFAQAPSAKATGEQS